MFQKTELNGDLTFSIFFHKKELFDKNPRIALICESHGNPSPKISWKVKLTHEYRSNYPDLQLWGFPDNAIDTVETKIHRGKLHQEFEAK